MANREFLVEIEKLVRSGLEEYEKVEKFGYTEYIQGKSKLYKDVNNLMKNRGIKVGSDWWCDAIRLLDDLCLSYMENRYKKQRARNEEFIS